MLLTLEKIEYGKLNSRQKEAYLLQHVSAKFADFGFITIAVSSDWGGADFIAQHISGAFIKVQQKSRLSFYKKYLNQNLYICFPSNDVWFLYPHDELLKKLLSLGKFEGTKAWDIQGGYSTELSKEHKVLLEPYILQAGLILTVE